MSRAKMFDELREEVNASLVLRAVSLSEFDQSQHNCWVWDATALPTQNHYVPVFLDLIQALESAGKIHPSKTTLVETTTGSAGAAVAYVASRLDYPIVIFIPEDMPKARTHQIRKLLSDSRSELRLTPPNCYVEGMVGELRAFLRRNHSGYHGRKLFALDHSRRKESVQTIQRICLDLLTKLPDEVKIDTCVVALGNGTTAMGLGQAVKAHNNGVKIIGVEPLEAPWCYTQKWPGKFEEVHGTKPKFRSHRLLGTGAWGVRFPNIDFDLLDDITLVAESTWRGQLIQTQQKHFGVGHSTAACLSEVARRSLVNSDSPTSFFSIFYDRIERYSDVVETLPTEEDAFRPEQQQLRLVS